LPILQSTRIRHRRVEVTPGHDPIDFELGQRHGLEQISVLDGTAP